MNNNSKEVVGGSRSNLVRFYLSKLYSTFFKSVVLVGHFYSEAIIIDKMCDVGTIMAVINKHTATSMVVLSVDVLFAHVEKHGVIAICT